MQYSQFLLVLGRVLLGGLFVLGGIHHFFIIPPLTSALAARGVPAARLALIGASVFQIVAGLLVMFGQYVAPAALGLMLFTIVASILFLNFWDLEGSARENARNGFQTNVAIIGGLLIAAATAM
jgi:putative oxidoreductase